MSTLSNSERQQYDDRRQRILNEVASLWTAPDSEVARSAYSYLLISDALGVEKVIDNALKLVPSDFRRDESEQEFLVALVTSALNRLMGHEPLKLL